jgi:hypothetical protein
MMAILLFAVVVLTFQALNYDGLMFRLGEWQFGWFARYFPPLTIAGFLGLIVLLWALLRWVRRKVAGRKLGASERQAMLSGLSIEQFRAKRTYRIVAVVTLVLAAATAGTAIHYLQLPGPTRVIGQINLASRAPTLLREGSVRVSNIRPLGPVASHASDLIFARQTIYLLPVGRTRMADGSEAANLFVQVTSPEQSRLPAQMTGLLRTSALPHEVATMYRNADYPVATDSAVVFLNERTANRPTELFLMQMAGLTLIGVLFTLFARRRRRRIEAAIEAQGGDGRP